MFDQDNSKNFPIFYNRNKFSFFGKINQNRNEIINI